MAGRRANGEGSIYLRKDGRWEGAVYVLTTIGTRKRVRMYGRTRAEVHGKLTEALLRVRQNVPTPDKPWRLGQYLDYWMDNVLRPSRRPSTHSLYETTVRLYLKPSLGQHQLARLSVPLVQGFLNRMLDNGHSVPQVEVMRKGSQFGSHPRLQRRTPHS